jgi:glycosyltransferase involved in cell wall biosynthesis
MWSADQVVIGIPVRALPGLLDRTLENLRRTAPLARVLLLPDRPDAATVARLAQLGEYRQLPATNSTGTASCFNRLIHSGDAEVYLLLESGALPAPGWLERLLSTFRRIPLCGLTGPSTNRSWNEQGVLPQGSDADADGETLARSVERRFGAACRKLAPLHSLGDFCYAVRREVVERIGDADEGYTGPCWEMDYNIRAQRAGFLGVWTCGAYVHRGAAPVVDSAELQKARERYQSKFCGLQLRGLKSDYRSHCRGDSCSNFAPQGLIEISLNARGPRVEIPVARVAECAPAEPPLVSCIMPTGNRRSFIADAIACFTRQDYPHLELLIVDDGTEPIVDLIPPDHRIRYLHLPHKLNLGAKRNYACEQARGSFIAHWDDDDWHAPDRIRRQMKALLGSQCKIVGTATLYYRHRNLPQAFRYTYRGRDRAYMGAPIYPRALWERIRFEEIGIGEDVRFMGRIPVAQRLDMNDPTLMICTLHEGNTSPKVTSGAFWTAEPPEKIAAIIAAGEQARSDELTPLISCIMPTHNRRSFIPLALELFHVQTYPRREMIVVDDGTDPVGDLLEGIESVRYVRTNRRLTIGAKRNIACDHATGALIAHWDDDDWYGPDRLAYQAAPIVEGRCDLTGLVNRHTLEMPAARFWTMTNDLHRRMFVGDIHGGTLMFRRSLLREGIRYPETNLAEDAAVVRQASDRNKRILRMEDAGLFLYLRHNKNTWQFDAGRFVDPDGWQPASAPKDFTSETLERYRTACLSA